MYVRKCLESGLQMSLGFTPAMYEASAEYIKNRLAGLSFNPEALLVLGSGLGFMADEMEEIVATIPYADIPHFRTSTAPGHKGQLVAGKLSGKMVLAMQGRLHLYEGYTAEEVAYPVRVANLLGADKLIISCACGGANTNYEVGDLAIITDYINFTHKSPLVGFDITGFNTRFVDMSYAYDREFIKLTKEVAAEKNIPLQEGVYFYMLGPQFESPAEIRAIQTLGGDLVGMSAVYETVMAQRLGMRTLGIALVTNMAAGILDVPLFEDEVLVVAKRASKVFSELIKAFMEKM